ncbi:hypothetical protein AAZX31_04G169000 [Glycine max]|uniref:FAR1 domain-containing protein n=1 Tax=Glycine max TaxID=3847 RepID=K7KKZ2_SOYBN|nr:hypothetical protein GLYMA_04G186100v4 [Glycine max]KAG5049884.1 hypothetical protein JHK85_010987 [Glycine max]KAG5066948.1 hypothetical protein JHK86_010679 [Glycine max]KAH1112002.1 hypothetical protein GYH30_010378 [Glycine max]KAH1112003.1 hypothetical protein GYH30_010378 [Glycine max]
MHDVIDKLDYVDLETAYMFCTWYSRIVNFSIQKIHVLRNSLGETIQRTFLCSRAGRKNYRGASSSGRKRKARNGIRCERCCRCMCDLAYFFPSYVHVLSIQNHIA